MVFVFVLYRCEDGVDKIMDNDDDDDDDDARAVVVEVCMRFKSGLEVDNLFERDGSAIMMQMATKSTTKLVAILEVVSIGCKASY